MIKKYIILMVLALLLVIGCGEKDIKSDQTDIIAARLVKTVQVQQKDVLEYLTYSGTLEAENSINISPGISAKIVKINVKEGNQVNAGTLLAELDDTQLKQAELQYLNLKKNFHRMSELFNTGSIDEKSFDEIEMAYNSAKENYDFLEENTKITAPISGVISEISLKEGEIFNSMLMPHLIRLVDLSIIKGHVNLSDSDINLIEPGTLVFISSDTSPQKQFKAKITYISPEADLFSGTYRCEFITKNENNLLKHNQFCRVKLITATSLNTLSIPPSALLNGNIVIVNDGNNARVVNVETGLENEDEIEILNGLDPEDNVIYIGNSGLEEGSKLQVNN